MNTSSTSSPNQEDFSPADSAMSLYASSAFDDAMKVPLFQEDDTKKLTSSSSRPHQGFVVGVDERGGQTRSNWNDKNVVGTCNSEGINNKRISQLLWQLGRENDKSQTLSRCLSLSMNASDGGGGGGGSVSDNSSKSMRATHFSSNNRGDLHACLSSASKLTKEIHQLFKMDSEYLIGSRRQRELEMNFESGDKNFNNDGGSNNKKEKGMLETASQYFNQISRSERQLHNRLRRDFQREVMRLEKCSKGVEKMEKDSVQRLSVMESGDNDHYGNSDDDTIGMSGVKQQLQEDALREERRQEIEQIKDSMMKVNEIYKDLGNLVEEQQYEIDDIENNIMASHARTEAGMGQLLKGEKFFHTIMPIVIGDKNTHS